MTLFDIAYNFNVLGFTSYIQDSYMYTCMQFSYLVYSWIKAGVGRTGNEAT